MSAVELSFSIGNQNGTLKFGHAKTCEPKHKEALPEFLVTNVARILGGDSEKAMAYVFRRRRNKDGVAKVRGEQPPPVRESVAKLVAKANADADIGDHKATRLAVIELGAEVLRWLEELDAAPQKTEQG